MRYLYGDLSNFPRQENFLEILQLFIDSAVGVLKLDHEIGKHLRTIDEDIQFLKSTLKNVDEFQQGIQEAIGRTLNSQTGDDIVFVIAKGTSDHLKKFVEDGKSKLAAKVEQRVRKTEQVIDQLSQEINILLKNFFIAGRLPIAKTSLRCELKDQQYQAFSEILDVIGIQCVYVLNTATSEFFSSPKKFGDLVEGKQSIPIGTKKAWLKKDPVPELLRIDDATLIACTDNDDEFSYRLAKRGSTFEGLRVQLKKNSPEDLQVFHIDQAANEEPISEELLSPLYKDKLLEFFKGLSPSVLGLYRNRSDISMIRLQGKEIIKERLIVSLIGRLVQFLAPTIREIDNRSPAKGELCLKVLLDEGKREDIYVEKKQLLSRLSELPDALRSLFAPLGLDTNVHVSEEVSTEFEKISPPSKGVVYKNLPRKFDLGQQSDITMPVITAQEEEGEEQRIVSKKADITKPAAKQESNPDSLPKKSDVTMPAMAAEDDVVMIQDPPATETQDPAPLNEDTTESLFSLDEESQEDGADYDLPIEKVSSDDPKDGSEGNEN